MQSLNGKTALVTGASSGIGLACARILAQDGARVVIMGRGEQALVRARAELATNLPEARIEIFVGDACQEDQVQAALAFAHGLATRLDILVPTVGGSEFKPLLLEDLAGVHRNIDMNFTNVFLIARHGVPLMQRGGTIVCISTAAVKRAFWGLSLYAAAKAALERFVRAAAFELGGAGIRINAVRPGMTASQATAEMRDMAGLVEHFAAETPLGRIGQPEDIARAVRFLAGPEIRLGNGSDLLGRRRPRPGQGAKPHGRAFRQGSDRSGPCRQVGRAFQRPSFGNFRKPCGA